MYGILELFNPLKSLAPHSYSISAESSLWCWKPSIIEGFNLQPNTFEMSKSCIVNYGVMTKITINACIAEAVVDY